MRSAASGPGLCRRGPAANRKVPESATGFNAPFEGIPASLGPGLRTVSGAKRRTRGSFPIACPIVPNSEKSRQGQKTQLVAAIAQGISVAAWARTNNVPRRTAFRWAGEAKVRASVESCRHRALDRAIGRMAKHVNWAVNGIVKLAKDANSESVRLAALRSIFSKMMAISEFAGSYANQAHLPREFLAQIVALYENTRLGRQEIHVEFLEIDRVGLVRRLRPGPACYRRCRVSPWILRALRHRCGHVTPYRGCVFPGPV